MTQRQRFHLWFTMENDAFKPCWRPEASRILQDLATKIQANGESIPIRDINGNTIGEAYVTRDPSDD